MFSFSASKHAKVENTDFFKSLKTTAENNQSSKSGFFRDFSFGFPVSDISTEFFSSDRVQRMIKMLLLR